MSTWILVANASRAKILTTDNLRVGKLDIMREFAHPESRKKGLELAADKQGSYRTDEDGHGSYSSKSDPKEVEAERFALELVNELKSGLGHNQFGELVIVASAHFYGLLKKHFQPSADLKIIHVSKDYTQCDVLDLHEKIKKEIFI